MHRSSGRVPIRVLAATLLVSAIQPVSATRDAGGRGGPDYAALRGAMVDCIGREIRSAAPDADGPALRQTLESVGRVPRERFVGRRLRAFAYRERPLSIGHGQTISDAYMVTVMTAALGLGPHRAVLDVGTGSGCQAAVLALTSDRVSSIEIVSGLARSAARRLRKLGYDNVSVRTGDGFAGWPEHAPFDGIIVAAGAAEVPRPLIDQLRIGGRLVMPIGSSWTSEQVLVVTRTGTSSTTRCSLGWSMFVSFEGAGRRKRDDHGLYADIPSCHSGPVARPDFSTLDDPAGS